MCSNIMELDPIFCPSTAPKQDDEVTTVDLDRSWQSCRRGLTAFLNVGRLLDLFKNLKL